MSVEITNIDIRREDFRPSTAGTDYLLGNLFTKHKAIIDIEVATFVTANNFNFTLDDTSVLNIGSNWAITDDNNSGRFREFFAGNEVKIFAGASSPFNGTYTIVKVQDNDNTLVISGASPSTSNTTMSVGYITVTDQPTGFRYFFGLPENNEVASFDSKIDGIEQQYKYGDSTGIGTSFVAMTQLFKKSAHLGSAQVKEVSSNTTSIYVYTFQIEHTFFVNPFYLDTQLNNLLLGDAPTYFDKQKCLRYVFRVQSHYDVDNPNEFLAVEIDQKLGNTGWLDENFNGGQTNYSISDLSYTRVSDSLALTGIENVLGTSDTTTVAFRVLNTTDTPFREAGNATKLVCNIIVLPENPAAYQNINQLMKENYCFDRAVATANSVPTPVDGDEFGTNFQIIENLKATFVNSGRIDVEFTANLGSEVISKVANLTDKYFLIAISTEDLDLGNEASDAITLKVAVDQFTTTVGDLITFSNEGFIEHPENDLAEISTGFTAISNDEIVGRCDFTLDISEYNPSITDVDVQIVAKKTDGTEAVLQKNNISVSGVQTVGGVQNIQITNPTGFKVNPNEIRSNLLFQRETDLDSGDNKGFSIAYPFLFRWEYWEQLILAGNLPNDFFAKGQSFLGYNQDWNRLGDFADWNIYFRVKVNLLTDEGATSATSETEIPHRTFDENSDWSCSIASYDQSGNALTTGSSPYIDGTIDTEIRAVFEKVSGSVPALANVSMVLRILVFEQGNYIDNFSFSSDYDRSVVIDQWWKSINADGLVEITKSGAVFTGKVDLSQVNLPSVNGKYTIYARIYESGTVAVCSFGTTTSVMNDSANFNLGGLNGLTLSQFIIWVDGIEQTTITGASLSGTLFTFGGKVTGDLFAVCSNDAVIGSVSNSEEITNAYLVGKSAENILIWVSGVELSTKPTFSMNNVTGTASWAYKVNGNYKLFQADTVHVSDTIVNNDTYTSASLIGLNLTDQIFIIDGIFMNQKFNSFDTVTGTIDIGFKVTGNIKVVTL